MAVSEVIALHTPCGLGWQRTVDIDRQGVVVAAVPPSRGNVRFAGRLRRALDNDPVEIVCADVHLADEDVFDQIEQVIACGRTGRLNTVWLTYAGDMPATLTPFVTRSIVAQPCSAEEFASVRGLEVDAAGAAISYSRGWPEALGASEAGALGPSAVLVSFVAGLRGSQTDLADVGLLAGATDGIDIDLVLAVLANRGIDEVVALESIRSSEILGLVSLRDRSILPFSPAVRDALARTRADRLRAAELLSGLPGTMGPGVVTALLACGVKPSEEQVGRLVGALAEMDDQIDEDTLNRLERLIAAVRVPVLDDAVRQVRARRALLRGADLGALDSALDAALTVERSVALLDGRDVGALKTEGSATVGDLFPGLVLPVDMAHTTLDPFLLAARGSYDDARRALDTPDSSSAARLQQMVVLFLCGDHETACRVGASDDVRSDVLVRLTAISLEALVGRFERAGAELSSLLGDDWAKGTPIHTAFAVLVASGLDVELTRGLLPSMPLPTAGRMGYPGLHVIRARAEWAVGATESARRRFAEAWDWYEERAWHGFMAAGAMDMIEAFAPDDLGSVIRAEAECLSGYAALATAIAERDVPAALRAARAWKAYPYTHGRALALAGTVAVDAGETDVAREALVEAQAVFRSLGAPIAYARAGASLRRFDRSVPVEPRNVAGDERLRREDEVLGLVGRGMTNKEIAATLHISASTAKRYVSNLLAQHDVRSRRDLAEIVRARERDA